MAVSGTITERKVLREIHDGVDHFVLQRLSIDYSKTFPIVNFPLDRHLLLASFETPTTHATTCSSSSTKMPPM